jgi:hypothetical protein
MEAISKRTGKKFSEKFSETAVKLGLALRPGEEVIKPKAKVNRKKRTKKVK